MRVIMVGFGTVGQAFARLLLREQSDLSSRYGLAARVVAIVDSGGAVIDHRGLDLRLALSRKSGRRSVADGEGGITGAPGTQVIENVDADLLVETTPTDIRTGQPGLDHLKAAFGTEKHVVTSNKGPLGVAFHSLHELAEQNGVRFRYSGAVGGGTPILDFGRTCSAGDHLVGVKGVLSGTCNFVLTRVEDGGVSFEQAVLIAQAEGYAETDPSLDIDGFDSALKLAIIANHLGVRRATVRDVNVKGISGLEASEVVEAKRDGKAIRLVASAEETLSVHPTLLPREDTLCVPGPYNAVRFCCRDSGPKVVVGKGAGGPETASSILRDIIEIHRGSSSRPLPVAPEITMFSRSPGCPSN